MFKKKYFLSNTKKKIIKIKNKSFQRFFEKLNIRKKIIFEKHVKIESIREKDTCAVSESRRKRIKLKKKKIK